MTTGRRDRLVQAHPWLAVRLTRSDFDAAERVAGRVCGLLHVQRQALARNSPIWDARTCISCILSVAGGFKKIPSRLSQVAFGPAPRGHAFGWPPPPDVRTASASRWDMAASQRAAPHAESRRARPILNPNHRHGVQPPALRQRRRSLSAPGRRSIRQNVAPASASCMSRAATTKNKMKQDRRQAGRRPVPVVEHAWLGPWVIASYKFLAKRAISARWSPERVTA